MGQENEMHYGRTKCTMGQEEPSRTKCTMGQENEMHYGTRMKLLNLLH